MARIASIGVLSILLAGGASNGFAAAILYGGLGNNGSSSNSFLNGALITVDQTTAAGTLVGPPANPPTVPPGITGLAFTSDDQLWATTSTRGASGSTLEELNYATGTPIFSAPLNILVGDLAVQPVTDTLYAISSGGVLYTVSKTGVTTLIGDTGTGRTGGLAFAPNGTLYLAGFDSNVLSGVALYTLNTANGAATLDFALQRFYDGLAVRPSDGLLFAAQSAVDGIFTINANTGVETPLGSVGFANAKASDLAFVTTPEPSTWMLVGAGALLAAFGRRRLSAQKS